MTRRDKTHGNKGRETMTGHQPLSAGSYRTVPEEPISHVGAQRHLVWPVGCLKTKDRVPLGKGSPCLEGKGGAQSQADRSSWTERCAVLRCPEGHSGTISGMNVPRRTTGPPAASETPSAHSRIPVSIAFGTRVDQTTQLKQHI